MPELPEVEIIARRATAALAGRRIAAVSVVGVNALRSIEPPPQVLEGATVTGVRRRGKLLLLDTDGEHLLLIHLMTGGALRWSGESSPRDRSLRLRIRFDDDGPLLRLRERGTRQAAWVRAIERAALDAGEIDELAKLGPEAWTGEARTAGEAEALAAALDVPRPLHALIRDQRVLAGIGRSWSDEIVWAAQRSPYQRGADLSAEERSAFVTTIEQTLAEAIERYEASVGEEPAEKLKKPLRVHGHEGEPCPRCGTKLRGVFFESHTIAYCPKEQTGGRALKDRRLSRLGIEEPVED